jgi:hypothetical protein
MISVENIIVMEMNLIAGNLWGKDSKGFCFASLGLAFFSWGSLSCHQFPEGQGFGPHVQVVKKTVSLPPAFFPEGFQIFVGKAVPVPDDSVETKIPDFAKLRVILERVYAVN